MTKIYRKILPSFLLAAIMMVAGGFSSGMVAAADMNPIDVNVAGDAMPSFGNNSVIIMHQQAAPADNTLRPCCESRQGGASAVQSSNLNSGVNLSMSSGFVATISGSDSIFEHKISELSSASPPKPDILSSVCLKE